jgi:glycosyltransferase involved in cell wall biosynthesis
VATEPISLVHLITSLHVGGAQMHLYKTLSRFNPRRFDSTVISLVKPGKVGDMLARQGVRVLTLNMTKGKPSLNGLWKLTVFLKQLKPQLLQTHLYHADLLGLLAGKCARVPHIFWNIRQSRMDFFCYRRTTGMTVKLCALLSRYVDKILVNSHAGLTYHAGLGYDRAKMVVIPNGFETERFRPHPESYLSIREELQIPAQARLVGMMARFDPQKDHATFFRAAKFVSDREPNTYFLLAGQGLEPDAPAVRLLLEESGLGPSRVFLLGERSDMPRLMAALDIFVSSSAFGEGFSNAIGEAMACGVLCVVTDVGDAALIVGETGIAAPPQQPEHLAQGILHLLRLEPEEYRQKSVLARQRLLQHFDLGKVVSRLESLYGESLSTPGSLADSAMLKNES